MKIKRDMLVALTFFTIVFATTALAGAAAVVTGVHPNAGPLAGGNAVTITGSGFTGATLVSFGDPALVTPVPVAPTNDNSITLNAPAGVDYGQVDVHVLSPEGWSSSTSDDLYNYVPAASINKVSPLIGSYNGGTKVTITGSYFTGADAVAFVDSNLASPHFGEVFWATDVKVINDNEITVTAPAGPLGDNAVIEVQTPAGLSQPWVDSKYTWAKTPSVSSVSPNSGSVNGGDQVTITGSYFTGATSVKFGNTEAKSFNVVNDNKITATVPAGTGKVHVTVTTPLGTSRTSSADKYTYMQVPIITSITPTSGSYLGDIIDTQNVPSVHPNADIIDILGYGFAGATQVTVGKNVVPADKFISITDNKISIYAPALNKNPYQPGKPKSVDIQVTTLAGSSVNSSKDVYTYIAVPKIYSLSPSKGPTDGGTAVTINGVGLTGTSKVTFEDGWSIVDEATITSVTDTQVKILTPQEDAGSLMVVVKSTGGISSLWQQANGNVFTYTGLPVVNSVAPNAGPTKGGTKVTITGENLKEVQKVMFGGNAATAVKVVDETHITAKSPAGTGIVDVTVVSPSGTSAISNNDKFTYQQVAPKVTKVAPTSGTAVGGNTVTIYGSGFTGATAVNFGAKSSSKLAVVSDTQLTATAPAGTGTVDITVVTPGGTSPVTSKDRYTYLSIPVVSSVSPTSGSVKGGNAVLIYGTNFKGTTAVYFGNTKVTTLSVNSAGTRITVPKAPAGVARGTVDITVKTPAGKSAISTNDKYTYK